MFKLILATCAALMAACVVSADEFDEQLAKYAAKTASIKAPAPQKVAACECGCEATGTCACKNCDNHTADKKNPGATGKFTCKCGCVATGNCVCHDCNHVKVISDAPLPAAPSATFKHDCGCPSASCNCGAGGCHCSENRIDNRQPSRWVRDGDHWYLYRGQQCLGVMKVNGSQFFQWNGTDYLPTPMKPPSVPPYRAEQTLAVPAARLWNVPVSGGAAPVCRS